MRESGGLGVEPGAKRVLERRTGAPKGRIFGIEQRRMPDDPVPGVLLLGKGDGRIRLVELPARPGAGLRVEDCVGKPGWWERRPGGGEGA